MRWRTDDNVYAACAGVANPRGDMAVRVLLALAVFSTLSGCEKANPPRKRPSGPNPRSGSRPNVPQNQGKGSSLRHHGRTSRRPLPPRGRVRSGGPETGEAQIINAVDGALILRISESPRTERG